MFDFSTLGEVFPLGIILFDLLFLLIAIPIEAYILNIRLQFDKRSSIYYAICINFFSSALGWFICFLIEQSFLPPDLKLQLLNYVFFNRILTNVQTLLILLGFIAFFTTFIMKFVFLRLLIALQQEQIMLLQESPQPDFPRRNSRRNYRSKLQNTSLVTTTLIANSLSYTAIAVVLFFISSIANNV
ncbi:MAG: filament integrity protein FraC [Cyanobacteria bacterium P01_A01_bin.84]